MRRENETGRNAEKHMIWNVLIVILVILIIVLAVLYFMGRRLQKKQDESQAQLDAMAQTASMLIIDKKRMKIKESGRRDQPDTLVPAPVQSTGGQSQGRAQDHDSDRR